MNTPLVSIIIPCYNDAEYIEQAVNSALNQTYPNKEVIVVDDGSNKETKSVLKQLEPKITQLITQENKGQSAARNVGIKAASGIYILALDSDDYFEHSFCSLAVPQLQRTEVKIVSCYANLIIDNVITEIYKPTGGNVVNFLVRNGALASAIFRKSDWSFCGGYDESMKNGYEDWEFNINLLKTGGKAEIIREALYNYRRGRNTTNVKANLIKYNLIKYIYNKHFDLVDKHNLMIINNLLVKLKQENFEKNKNKKRLEFRIGFYLLKPLRYIKKILFK